MGSSRKARILTAVGRKTNLFGRFFANSTKQRTAQHSVKYPSNLASNSLPCISIRTDCKLEKLSLRLTDMPINIHPRDLLALDIDNSTMSRQDTLGGTRWQNHTYVCLPRKDFFLVAFGNIKVIVIKGDDPRVLLFEPNKPAVEDFAHTIAQVIPSFIHSSPVSDGDSISGIGVMEDLLVGSISVAQPDASFELGVMEEVLKETSDIFDRRIRLLKPLISNLLKDDEDIDADEDLTIKLQKLGPLEDAIQFYELEVKEARQCIVRLLQNDEDMHAIASTQDPAKMDITNLSQEQMSTIASVEILLENYVHKINRSYDTLIYFRQKLNTWKSMTSMSMQMKRNKIMNYNLRMGISAVSIGACSAVAGIFGMNLTSGLESHPWAFFGTSIVMVSFAAAFQLSLSRLLFGRDLNYTFREQASRIEGMKTLLIERADTLDDSIKIVFDILDNTGKYKDSRSDTSEGDSISKKDFHKLFEENARIRDKDKKNYSQSVSQLFELLDIDKNEYLVKSELSPRFVAHAEKLPK